MYDKMYNHRLATYAAGVPESWYAQVESYKEVLNGLSRINNQNIFLVDFCKGEILFVADTPSFLCGIEPEEVKILGKRFNEKFMRPDEIEKVNEFLWSGFKFIESQPLEERKRFSISYDYHLADKLVNASLTPVLLSPDGKPWIVVFKVEYSTHESFGNAIIRKFNTSESWYYCMQSKKWRERKVVVLTELEYKVLLLSSQGKRELEISSCIFRSKDGLKSIKRRLYQKMDVSNITEAVSEAIAAGLL